MSVPKISPPPAQPLSPRVTFVNGNCGLPKICVHTPWSDAEIYLHGAHITHFQRKDEPPILFLSRESRFTADQAIRGGIPLILPWFGSRPGQPSHGFARVKTWELAEIISAATGAVTLRLRLPETAEAGFPPITAEYLVTVSQTLELQLTVTNASSDRELAFEVCLHTYFSVGDITTATVSGLKDASYLDKVDNFSKKTETSDAIKISSEVDRVYLDTTNTVEIRDPALHRKIIIEKQNSASTILWNPWIAKSQQMSDFAPDEYQKMLCVESGNVTPNQLTIAPNKSATLTATISSSNEP